MFYALCTVHDHSPYVMLSPTVFLWKRRFIILYNFVFTNLLCMQNTIQKGCEKFLFSVTLPLLLTKREKEKEKKLGVKLTPTWYLLWLIQFWTTQLPDSQVGIHTMQIVIHWFGKLEGFFLPMNSNRIERVMFLLLLLFFYHELDLKLPIYLILDAMHLLKGCSQPLSWRHTPSPPWL